VLFYQKIYLFVAVKIGLQIDIATINLKQISVLNRGKTFLTLGITDGMNAFMVLEN
jgi:hypothetical protein